MNSINPPVPTPTDATAQLSPLKRAFLALEDAQSRLVVAQRAGREPIAVIGLGCRVPGAANPAEFWELLRDGRDAMGQIPPDRFDIDAYFDPDPAAPGRIAVREAGFIGEVDRFDPGFFGIAPREASGMDPQQRLLLEVSWEALEHAGQAPDRLAMSATGVYVGLCSTDYAYLQLHTGDRSLLDSHYTSGVAHSVASGRISYLLGLQGPSVTVDTACSSSLVAVHLACQALRSGECRMALAGGVNLMLSADLFVAFSHSRMLAPDGRCKTFDAAADGFARGEGAGVVVLKRLVDAQADGDRILAVLRGSAINQDGPSSGLTAPNGPAQEAVIRMALERAGVAPADIGYVEAHGTGTQLGDPLEVRALGNIFGPGRDAEQPLRLASVKTNLGHLEAAAGVTGLIKVVLALQNRALPAHLHFKNPSPHITWADLPIEVPTTLTPWDPIGGRRIAGVSAFGFSGTNAHVIVEEAPRAAVPASSPDETTHLYTLSARDEGALRALAARHAAALDERRDASLASLCFTANAGRARFAHRAVVAASNVDDLRTRLHALAGGEQADGLRTARMTRRDPPRIAFLFTGQGSQYASMARGLYDSEPVFRAALDRCAQGLDGRLDRPLLEVLYAADSDPNLLDRTEYTQPALFAIEYGLAQLWQSWGIKPAIVMGHSIGEVVAACVAGVMNLDDALGLIAERGRLMGSLPAGGAMAAIHAPAAEVESLVAPYAASVAIAAFNTPEQCVISGAATEVDLLCTTLAQRGVRCQRLPVSHAFHSPLVEPMLDAFERVAEGIKWSAPSIRLISNLTGAVAGPSTLGSANYWRRHVREPVRFADAARSLVLLRPDICIEIGPSTALLPFVQAAIGTTPTVLAPSLRKGRPDRAQILDALATCHLEGAEIDWRAVYAGQACEIVDLPTYPFQRERCWFSARMQTLAAGPRGRPTGNSLLGTRLRSAGVETIYETRVSAEQPAFVAHHKVQGQVVMPATAYLEGLLAAACDLFGAGPRTVEEVTLQEAMLLGDEQRTVQLVLAPTADGAVAARLCSVIDAAAADAGWTCHVSAALSSTAPSRGANVECSLAEARLRCAEQIDTAAFYAGFAQRGLGFGPIFESVTQLWRGNHQAFGEVTLREELSSEPAGYHMHPVLLDGCLQVMGAALMTVTDDELYLPFAIGRYTHHRDGGQSCWAHATAEAGQHGEIRRADLRVFDADGELLAELVDVRLKRVARDALARIGGRSIDDSLYETVWESSPLDIRSGQAESRTVSIATMAHAANGSVDRLRQAATSASDWLILADAAGVAAGLAGRLRARGDRCQFIHSGEAFDAEKLRAFERPLLGVIDARALDFPDIDVLKSGDFGEVVTDGAASAMRTAQMLVGLTPAPQFWMLTRGAQPIAGSERPPAVTAATLWGLGKTLRLEHPELRTVCIDLDPAIGTDEEDSLLAELDAGGREGEVALRGSTRYVARLARLRSSAGPGTQAPWRLVPTVQGSLASVQPAPCERRAPAAGEVEIAVEAVALNFRDVLNVLGLYPGDAGPLGGECAGVVSAVGAGVAHLRVGDPVMALAVGSFASHVIAQADFVQIRPPGVGAEEGASFSIAYLTAGFCLEHLSKLRAGQRVLIHAAGGGVGMAALCLARRAGAEIFATAGSPWKRDMLRSMGATHVFDSRSADFADNVMVLTGGHGVDVVLNSLGGDLIEPSFAVLASGGCFIEIGKSGIKSHEWVEALGRDIRYHIVDWGQTARTDPALIAGLYVRLAEEMRAGKVAALPRHVFALDHAAQAFQFMARGRHAGKIIVRVAGAPSWAPRRDATYLVTGGLSGLGLQVARWLAEGGAGRLVLIGRRGVTPESASMLDALRGLGTEIVTEAIDVTDEAGMRALLKRQREAGPPLRGVWHCAGVLDDAMLMQQNAGRYARAFAPKVQGAALLDALTRGDPLDCFVLFSSVAAVLGAPGQSNYAAANAFLDAMAHHRAGRGLTALSINWGSWSEVGAAANPRIIGRSAAQGLAAVTPEQGLFAMKTLLDRDVVQAAVLPIDWARYFARLAPTGVPTFLENVAERAGASSSTVAAAPRAAAVFDLRERLAEVPEARRRALVSSFVRERALHALGIDRSKSVDPRTALSDLGLDSLLAVELRNTLSTAIGRPLSATLLFDYPTLDALTDYLLELLEPEKLGDVAPAVSADLGTSLVGSIEELSDAEVDRMIEMRAQRK